MLPKIACTLFHRAGFAEDVFDRDGGTLIAEVSTPFVASPCGIKGSIMGEDFKGNHLELVKDINQNMEDFIIEFFT